MIRPLGDRVVIQVAEAETKTASGIILADTAKEKPMKGVVVAVGPGEFKDGQRSPMDVKVGDAVIYSKYAGICVFPPKLTAPLTKSAPKRC